MSAALYRGRRRVTERKRVRSAYGPSASGPEWARMDCCRWACAGPAAGVRCPWFFLLGDSLWFILMHRFLSDCAPDGSGLKPACRLLLSAAAILRDIRFKGAGGFARVCLWHACRFVGVCA
jgi:hypothetical protein